MEKEASYDSSSIEELVQTEQSDEDAEEDPRVPVKTGRVKYNNTNNLIQIEIIVPRNGSNYNCPECKKVYKRRDYCINHCRKVHGKICTYSYECLYCGEKFDVLRDGSAHARFCFTNRSNRERSLIKAETANEKAAAVRAGPIIRLIDSPTERPQVDSSPEVESNDAETQTEPIAGRQVPGLSLSHQVPNPVQIWSMIRERQVGPNRRSSIESLNMSDLLALPRNSSDHFRPQKTPKMAKWERSYWVEFGRTISTKPELAPTLLEAYKANFGITQQVLQAMGLDV